VMKPPAVQKADTLVGEYVSSHLEGDESIVEVLSNGLQGSLVAASLVGIVIMLVCSALAGWSDVGFVLGAGLGVGLGLLLMIKWKALVVTERRLLLKKKDVWGKPVAIEAEYSLGACGIVSYDTKASFLRSAKIACDSDSVVLKVQKPWFDEATAVAAVIDGATRSGANLREP
jgi:hypothetical protein